MVTLVVVIEETQSSSLRETDLVVAANENNRYNGHRNNAGEGNNKPTGQNGKRTFVDVADLETAANESNRYSGHLNNAGEGNKATQNGKRPSGSSTPNKTG